MTRVSAFVLGIIAFGLAANVAAEEQINPPQPAVRARPAQQIAEVKPSWRAMVRDAKVALNEARPFDAIEILTALFEVVPAPKRPSPFGGDLQNLRSDAAETMARAKAEVGAYVEAIKWSKRSLSESPGWCGNCIDAGKTWRNARHKAWEIAQLPYPKAVSTLRSLRSRGYAKIEPPDMPYTRKEVQALHYVFRAEATLILGELHLRNGNLVAAQRELLYASDSGEGFADIALAHLRRIER